MVRKFNILQYPFSHYTTPLVLASYHPSPYYRSHPRIDLRQQVPARIARPIPTILIRRRRNDRIFNISRPLHNVGIKTARDMPGDMAVEGPDARIVLLPLEDLIKTKNAILARVFWHRRVHRTSG